MDTTTRNRWTRHLERLLRPEQQPRYYREAVTEAVAVTWVAMDAARARDGTAKPNNESGAGPEQPLDSEVHGTHTVYNQTAAVVVPQLQDEALYEQYMPAGLGSGVIGFAGQ